MAIDTEFTESLNAFAAKFKLPSDEWRYMTAEILMVGRRLERQREVERKLAAQVQDRELEELTTNIRQLHAARSTL